MADVQRVAELYQDNRKLFAELDAEKARLKDELLAEMRNSPKLQAQVESFGGFDRFSDDWLSMVERYALRMGTSQDPVETMRRVTLDEMRAMAARSAASENETGPVVDSGIAASGRIAPEAAREKRIEEGGFQGQGLFQEGSPVEVSSRDLGVPAGAELKDYIRAAKKFHDQLKYESENGKPVIQPQLGKPVRFSGKGWKKNAFVGADPIKWKLFSKLREIIEFSSLVETQESNKKRKDGFTRFHKLESQIILDGGQLFRTRIVLAEDVNGNLFYNIFRAEENESSPQLETRQQSRGHEELFQDELSSDAQSITIGGDKVNIQILSGGKESSDRGPVQIYPEFFQDIEGQTGEEALASGNAAMEKVIAEHTDVLDAMWRDDVGSISFYWGTPGKGKKFKGGFGISHLIAHRNAQGYDGEAIARKMPEVLAYGEQSRKQGTGTQGERRFFTYNGYTAVVSLYKFENRQTWLLTGWIDENVSDAQGEGYDSQSATSNGPTLTRSEDGAETEINVKPLGTDGKPLFHGSNTDDHRGPVQIYPELFQDAADISPSDSLEAARYGCAEKRESKRRGEAVRAADHVRAEGGIRVVPKPENIKSAIGNRGRWNPNDGRILYQDGKEEEKREYIREDFVRKQDDATAKVVTLPEGSVPDIPVKDFGKWVIELLSKQGGDIVIKSTGELAEFTNSNIRASTKRSSIKRKGAKEHRNAYLVLREMIANAEYWYSVEADEKHKTKGGQNVYTSALAMGGKLYSVVIKNDVPTEFVKNKTKEQGIKIGDSRYKDHSLSEIEIAPALSQGYQAIKDGALQGTTDAINEVSLGILRGAVKPTRLENNVLRQGEYGHRGSVQIYPESYLIRLFEKADLSTLLHETGHVFFEEMERLVRAGAADESVVADYQTMRDWLGAKEGESLTIKQRERAARGFEAYLMEGRAPAPELQSAFRRFRKWLLRIYQSALGLRVELNDDVRAVFSRMISTEQEISRAARENELLELTAREIGALGLTDAEAAQINAASANAREQAAEALQLARDANRKERRKRYVREAAAELAGNRTYIARKDLRKTPLDIDAVKNGFGASLAAALRKKIPASIKRDGAEPEVFAAQHGYESAGEMFTDILNSQSKGNAIREIVDRREAESDAGYSAMEALLDTRDISTQMELVGRRLADLVGVRQIERRAYSIAARRELAGMPAGKAMQTGRYIAAMRRNILSWRRALFAGDREKALDFNRKALLNYEFAKQSRELAKSARKFADAAKRFADSKSASPDVRFIVTEIASRFGVVRENAALARGRNFNELLPAWLEEVKADGYDLFLDEAIIRGPGRPWRELSVAELESLAETITQITTVERNRRKLLTAKGRQDLQEVADSIAKSILAHNRTRAVRTVGSEPKAVKFLKGLHAIHTKVEALCLAVDGGRMGPAWEHIYRPITEAEDVQARRLRDAGAKLKELFSVYSRRELSRMGCKKEFVGEIGESVTFENRLAVALNMGNAENIARLKAGHNLDDAKIAAVVKTLTARDWQFVQSVWDYLDTFKDESFNLQQEITGMRPKSVEAQPFEVKTADGQTLRLAGGYYPISYNPKKGERAFGQNQKEQDRELFGGRNYGQAQTKQGHLKARAGQGQGTPLQLDLSVMTNHVFNVVHDLSYRKAVLDVAKVIKNRAVQEAFTSTVGPRMYRQLRPWLQDVAGERQEPMHAVNKWANWARTSTTIMRMGYKATAMLMQPLGITRSMDAIGCRWTAYGIGKIYGNICKFSEMLQETYARSPFMQNRAKSFDREVRDITKKIKPSMGRFGWIDVIRDKAFVPMGALQMGVDLPTWWGAYARGLKENGGNEERAALYADMIVRTYQDSGTTKDLAAVQRGSELQKLFTMFYSCFNTLYNIGARHIRELRADPGPAGILKAANAALLLWFVPVVLGEIVAGRGPEDDEDWWKWSAPLLMQHPFQTIVGARDVVAGICGEYGCQLPAAQSAPAAIVKWYRAMQKAVVEQEGDGLMKPTVEATGYATSLPLKQASITAFYIWDWITGKDPDWYWRDLLFVKPKGPCGPCGEKLPRLI